MLVRHVQHGKGCMKRKYRRQNTFLIFHIIKEASEDENFDSTQCLGYCNALEISDCSELLGSYRAAIAPETKHFSNNVEGVFELFQT